MNVYIYELPKCLLTWESAQCNGFTMVLKPVTIGPDGFPTVAKTIGSQTMN